MEKYFKYIIKRIVLSLFSLFVIASLIFVLVQAIPGDGFVQFNRTQPEIIAAMKAHYGLDKPLGEQYLNFLGRIVRLDFGISSSYSGKSVNSIIAETFPVSLRISVFATMIGSFFGILVAAGSVMSKKKVVRIVLRIIILFGIALSTVIIAPLFQLIFAVKLKWLPVGLLTSPLHYVLPVASLACVTMAVVAFVGHNSMAEACRSPYAYTAREKGLTESEVFLNHILRNSSVSLINVIIVSFAGNTVSVFFLESVYSISGIGKVMVAAVQSLDYGLIMGLTVFLGMIFIFLLFVMDILCAFVDPRIMFEE